MALGGAFNNWVVGLKCTSDSLAEAMAAHEEEGRRIEKGEPDLSVIHLILIMILS